METMPMTEARAGGPPDLSITLPVRTLAEANLLAQAIVNTIPEPFLVLDADLRVLEASRSFY